ncbi:unnamed protein product [Dicrocoelium dendriticum]|nr:unnamed protein product [Dicrocoelium dendriticum]
MTVNFYTALRTSVEKAIIEYADLLYGTLNETDNDSSDEESSLPASSVAHECNTECDCSWLPQFQAPSGETDGQMTSGSDVNSQADDSHKPSLARVTSSSAAEAWSF